MGLTLAHGKLGIGKPSMKKLRKNTREKPSEDGANQGHGKRKEKKKYTRNPASVASFFDTARSKARKTRCDCMPLGRCALYSVLQNIGGKRAFRDLGRLQRKPQMAH
ncbi:hypothetical protein BDV06DRAFT_196798, partial [Aspergillus oleicola]